MRTRRGCLLGTLEWRKADSSHELDHCFSIPGGKTHRLRMVLGRKDARLDCFDETRTRSPSAVLIVVREGSLEKPLSLPAPSRVALQISDKGWIRFQTTHVKQLFQAKAISHLTYCRGKLPIIADAAVARWQTPGEPRWTRHPSNLGTDRLPPRHVRPMFFSALFGSPCSRGCGYPYPSSFRLLVRSGGEAAPASIGWGGPLAVPIGTVVLQK